MVGWFLFQGVLDRTPAAGGPAPHLGLLKRRITHPAAQCGRMGDAAVEEAQMWGGSAGSRRAIEYALE